MGHSGEPFVEVVCGKTSLTKVLTAPVNDVEPFYRHYKGMMYRAIDLVHHSETQEALVLYEALYENKTGKFWVRPKEMFLETVVIEGVRRPRFEYIGPSNSGKTL